MYRKDLDTIKGISIIAVVLFHLGIIKSGYLGVDAFFVVNGYLIIPAMMRRISSLEFSFLQFLEKRLFRLYPLIAVASLFSMMVGYFIMLPDHYENLAQSVFASNIFSQNILSSLTTENYWDVSNDYKPFMHFWYVGVLFEAYIVLPLVLMLAYKISGYLKKDALAMMSQVLIGMTIVSFLIYLTPENISGSHFYFIQSRIWEIGVGGIVAICQPRMNNICQIVKNFAFNALFIFLLFSSLICVILDYNNNTDYVIGSDSVETGLIFSKNVLLVSTVFATCCLLLKNSSNKWSDFHILPFLGKMSYSIFVWHQIILALFRYSFSSSLNLEELIVYFVVVSLLSFFTYKFIEIRFKYTRRNTMICIWGCIAIIAASLYVYTTAGIVRDIPELEISQKETRRGFFAEYNDRVDKICKSSFSDGHKYNVLVYGNSFGRDFCNVLLESKYKDSCNIYYTNTWLVEDAENLISKSDLIFVFMPKHKVPACVWDYKKKEARVIGIGTKNFGGCVGEVFIHRFDSNYHQLNITPLSGYWELNDLWKKEWGRDYVDFMTPVKVAGDKVKVFTPDNKYISQDSRHLTRAGAKWYADILDLNYFFSVLDE